MNLPLAHIWQPAASASQRLVIVLHGRGDSAEGFLWLQEELDIDELNFLLLNAPDKYYTGYSWYDLPPDQLPGIQQSGELLARTLEQVEREGYSPDKTILFGFSQGCLMTLEFGSRYSRALAGYVGISGYCYDPDGILREMNPATNTGNWLITHGTMDDVLPVEVTRAQVKRLNDGGFRIDYREYPKTHTIDPEREISDIRAWLRTLLQGLNDS
jgi:phospholipase/carboxylesterase